MKQSLEAMTTALRVLAALTEKRQPDAADIEALTAFAGEKPPNIGLDEFACDVINKAIAHRAAVRGRNGE